MIDFVLFVFTLAMFVGGAFFGHYVGTRYGTWSTYTRSIWSKYLGATGEKLKARFNRK